VYHRFVRVSAIGAHELHSSIATLFFCYGIIGTLLFARSWREHVRAEVRTRVIVGAGLAYSAV